MRKSIFFFSCSPLLPSSSSFYSRIDSVEEEDLSPTPHLGHHLLHPLRGCGHLRKKNYLSCPQEKWPLTTSAHLQVRWPDRVHRSRWDVRVPVL
ncbi:hypothetical protein CEXT_326161 [Caerostris extrusa]|uniref:Secreted protein n=1 Tax=Caerostris extrusa TaxID=172846 RepID=A0AAV4PDF5_CAEEX|nr:hypothetical protein CEXT_326161 [Caerostris extrusa]